MPLRDTFSRTLHDQLRPVTIWGLAIFLLVAFYTALYPAIGAMDEIQHMLDQLPPAFKALFAAEALDLSSAEGYLKVELFSFTGPLMLLAYAVAAGSGATAAEEERGTIDLLLSMPVTRTQVVLQKTAAFLLLTVLLGVCMWLGVVLGAIVGPVSIDLGHIAGAIVSLVLLALSFGAIALFLGALTGRRSLAIAITALLILVTYMLNAMGTLIDWLEPFRPLSPFYLYLGGDPLTKGVQLAQAAMLLLIAVVASALAVVAFDRRDLRT